MSMQTPSSSGAPNGTPLLWLRLEGLATFAGAVLALAMTPVGQAIGLSWWQLVILFFAPDLSMIGYVAGPRIGAWLYNAAHVCIGPVALSLGALAAGSERWLGVALLWAGHIGLDRLLAFGLKYETGFYDTHLGRIGRQAA